jgi:hypothetical protein
VEGIKKVGVDAEGIIMVAVGGISSTGGIKGVLVIYPGDQGSDFQRQAIVPINRLNKTITEMIIQR